jgi:hypothetical protein
MSWEGFGGKRSWPHFKVLSRHLSGGTEGNHEKPQSGWPVFGPRFETWTSRIRSRRVNHSTTAIKHRMLHIISTGSVACTE